MPRFEKGSTAAKERMAHLRSLRKKKGTGVSDVAVDPMVSQPAVVDIDSPKIKTMGKGSKRSPWIKWVAEYAKQHSMNYFEALKDPDVKKGYHSQK